MVSEISVFRIDADQRQLAGAEPQTQLHDKSARCRLGHRPRTSKTDPPTDRRGDRRVRDDTASFTEVPRARVIRAGAADRTRRVAGTDDDRSRRVDSLSAAQGRLCDAGRGVGPPLPQGFELVLLTLDQIRFRRNPLGFELLLGSSAFTAPRTCRVEQ